jgi:hypothetical protein
MFGQNTTTSRGDLAMKVVRGKPATTKRWYLRIFARLFQRRSA